MLVEADPGPAVTDGHPLALVLDGSASVTIELARAQQALAALLSGHAVDARATYACELVVEEWVSNVWRHGDPRRAPARHTDLPREPAPGSVATVDVRIRVEPQQIRLDFRDHGIAFDPTHATPTAPAAGLATAKVGGLGLRMMRGVIQHWAYERRDNVNLLSIWIQRAPVPA